jgi:hypothetical protein
MWSEFGMNKESDLFVAKGAQCHMKEYHGTAEKQVNQMTVWKMQKSYDFEYKVFN